MCCNAQQKHRTNVCWQIDLNIFTPRMLSRTVLYTDFVGRDPASLNKGLMKSSSSLCSGKKYLNILKFEKVGQSKAHISIFVV